MCDRTTGTTVRPYDRTTVRPYDRTTVQGATFNIRGQLYRGHANATALSSSPVVNALGSESGVGLPGF